MQKKKSLISVAVWLMVIEVIMKLLGFIKQMVIANFYGANKEVGEVRLENGIIQGDAFSPLLFVLMIDPS